MGMTKKAERTKAKLLQSARELIAERGFDSVSVEEITKHCGVAKGTFYHYFECKEDVISQISFQSLKSMVTEATEAGDSVEDRLSRFITVLMREAQETGVHIMREWLRDVMDPQTTKTGDTAVRVGFSEIRGIIESGVTSGELKKNTPLDMLSQLFLAHIYGALTIWCMVGGRENLEEMAAGVSPEYVRNMLVRYKRGKK